MWKQRGSERAGAASELPHACDAQGAGSGRRRRGRRPGALPVALVALALLAAGPARSGLIASNLVQVATDAGTISLASRLYDNAAGDSSRWLFEYELTGDYQPDPGVTNGLSSLQILFGDLVFAQDETAPAGWLVDCCLTAPPFGAGFDLPDSTGFGVGPSGGATFSFTTAAGIPWSDEPSGSFAGSHWLDVPVDLVLLVDDASGRGPIVPTPEPGSGALAGLGLALLGRAARRRRRP